MSSKSKILKYSEIRQKIYDKLEELQVELDDITTNVTSRRSIDIKNIDRALEIEVDATKLMHIMHTETKKIQANAGVKQFLQTEENEELSFNYNIDRQIDQVDEIHGFIMEAFNEFVEIIIQYSMSHSRPDLLRHILKKMHKSRNPSPKIVHDKRRTQSAKKHSSRKRSTRRHSAK
jgi:deoxyribodipyrimidine photolyase